MSFKLEKCTEADFNMDMANVIFDAFGGRSTVINATHPDNMTSEGRARAVVALQAMFQNKQASWIKVVQGKELVGVSWWFLFDLKGQKIQPSILSGPEGNWANDEEKLFAQCLVSGVLRKRNHVLSAKPHKVFALHRICVKPQYQRQGVGSMMMEWGTGMADELGAESAVEATEEGRGLYAKHGYVCPAVHAMPVDVLPQFEQRPKQYLYFMHRSIAEQIPSNLDM